MGSYKGKVIPKEINQKVKKGVEKRLKKVSEKKGVETYPESHGCRTGGKDGLIKYGTPPEEIDEDAR